MITVSLPNPAYFAKGVLRFSDIAFGKIPLQHPLPNSSRDFPISAMDEWLGTPTLTSLALRQGDTQVVLRECVMTVSQEKNIISTALQGRSGTIKEYISDGDYQIEVSAAVQPNADGNDNDSEKFSVPPDRYPMEELRELMILFRESESLEVSSGFLDLFGVESVVVKSYEFTQETHQNRQSFRLTLLSDAPYEIKLMEEDNAKA
jgi:hypothetical protein